MSSRWGEGGRKKQDINSRQRQQGDKKTEQRCGQQLGSTLNTVETEFKIKYLNSVFITQIQRTCTTTL